MSTFTKDEVESFRVENGGGNANCRKIWMAKLREDSSRWPCDGDSLNEYKQFIQKVFLEEKWKSSSKSGKTPKKSKKKKKSKSPEAPTHLSGDDNDDAFGEWADADIGASPEEKKGKKKKKKKKKEKKSSSSSSSSKNGPTASAVASTTSNTIDGGFDDMLDFGITPSGGSAGANVGTGTTQNDEDDLLGGFLAAGVGNAGQSPAIPTAPAANGMAAIQAAVQSTSIGNGNATSHPFRV